MKRFIIAFSLLVFNFSLALAQDFDTTLAQTYTQFDTSKAYAQKLYASNQFKLIAKMYPTKWIANYYAAYSIAVLSYMEPNNDKRDPMLDEADAFFKKIEAMDSSNDEVAVLGALLAGARLSVNPMMRWQKYGDMQNDYYAMVKKINPKNPRMYYLQANAKYYTPANFGGGADVAKPLYQKALEYFANDSQDIEKPHWGKGITMYMLSQCDKAADSKAKN